MSTNVKVQTARLSKGCVTQVTFEWFFTSMNAPVFLKVGIDNKGTVTHVTFMCLLTCGHMPCDSVRNTTD